LSEQLHTNLRARPDHKIDNIDAQSDDEKTPNGILSDADHPSELENYYSSIVAYVGSGLEEVPNPEFMINCAKPKAYIDACLAMSTNEESAASIKSRLTDEEDSTTWTVERLIRHLILPCKRHVGDISDLVRIGVNDSADNSHLGFPPKGSDDMPYPDRYTPNIYVYMLEHILLTLVDLQNRNAIQSNQLILLEHILVSFIQLVNPTLPDFAYAETTPIDPSSAIFYAAPPSLYQITINGEIQKKVYAKWSEVPLGAIVSTTSASTLFRNAFEAKLFQECFVGQRSEVPILAFYDFTPFRLMDDASLWFPPCDVSSMTYPFTFAGFSDAQKKEQKLRQQTGNGIPKVVDMVVDTKFDIETLMKHLSNDICLNTSEHLMNKNGGLGTAIEAHNQFKMNATTSIFMDRLSALLNQMKKYDSSINNLEKILTNAVRDLHKKYDLTEAFYRASRTGIRPFYKHMHYLRKFIELDQLTQRAVHIERRRREIHNEAIARSALINAEEDDTMPKRLSLHVDCEEVQPLAAEGKFDSPASFALHYIKEINQGNFKALDVIAGELATNLKQFSVLSAFDLGIGKKLVTIAVEEMVAEEREWQLVPKLNELVKHSVVKADLAKRDPEQIIPRLKKILQLVDHQVKEIFGNNDNEEQDEQQELCPQWFDIPLYLRCIYTNALYPDPSTSPLCVSSETILATKGGKIAPFSNYRSPIFLLSGERGGNLLSMLKLLVELVECARFNHTHVLPTVIMKEFKATANFNQLAIEKLVAAKTIQLPNKHVGMATLNDFIQCMTMYAEGEKINKKNFNMQELVKALASMLSQIYNKITEYTKKNHRTDSSMLKTVWHAFADIVFEPPFFCFWIQTQNEARRFKYYWALYQYRKQIETAVAAATSRTPDMTSHRVIPQEICKSFLHIDLIRTAKVIGNQQSNTDLITNSQLLSKSFDSEHTDQIMEFLNTTLGNVMPFAKLMMKGFSMEDMSLGDDNSHIEVFLKKMQHRIIREKRNPREMIGFIIQDISGSNEYDVSDDEESIRREQEDEDD
jgi:hypothetical protein